MWECVAEAVSVWLPVAVGNAVVDQDVTLVETTMVVRLPETTGTDTVVSGAETVGATTTVVAGTGKVMTMEGMEVATVGLMGPVRRMLT